MFACLECESQGSLQFDGIVDRLFEMVHEVVGECARRSFPRRQGRRRGGLYWFGNEGDLYFLELGLWIGPNSGVRDAECHDTLPARTVSFAGGPLRSVLFQCEEDDFPVHRGPVHCARVSDNIDDQLRLEGILGRSRCQIASRREEFLPLTLLIETPAQMSALSTKDAIGNGRPELGPSNLSRKERSSGKSMC